MKFSFRNTILNGFLYSLFLLIGTQAVANNEGSEIYLRIYGKVVDNDNSSNLSDCDVSVFQDGEKVENYISESRGKYEFFLPAGHVYRFYFEKSGYVTKNIEIDCVDADEMKDPFIFSLKADISLFKAIDGMDYSILMDPIGKGVCNGRRGKVIFNRDYTRMMEERIAGLNIPMEPNMSQSDQVSIERVITDMPDEEELITVHEAVALAENGSELLTHDTADHICVEKVETVSNTKTLMEANELVSAETATKKIVVKPIELVESEPYDSRSSEITWRVQLGAFSTSNINAFQGISNVDFVTGDDGMTRCVVGYFSTPLEAAKHKIKMINEGYKDAFLTAYRGNKQITFEETNVNLDHISYTKIKDEFNE